MEAWLDGRGAATKSTRVMARLRLRKQSDAPFATQGTARVDRRTKDMIPRLQGGEIAVINHRDLDRVAADGLIEAGVVAVINCSQSISGRYPNEGPIRIVQSGIVLIDGVDPAFMDAVHEGDVLSIEDGEVRRTGELLGQGRVLDEASIEVAMEAARTAIGTELERFAANTLEYIQKEARLTFEPLELPPLHTKFAGRHALVVVRGHDYRSDLAALRPYIREYRPVLIGVDGGADALLEHGLKPDIIIGDFDSVSPKGLACGAELVHHVHPDGRAPGRENLLEWGVEYIEFVAEGTSEDVAMLLAYESKSQLIVAVGTHATMVEFLDKGRPGMASTFLTRLRLGPMLVDAKGVSRLYEGRVRRLDIFLLVGAALIAMLVVAIVAEPIHVFARGLWVTIKDLFSG
ncbi:MAG TPA: putative cytokinetic ring protein SteA [Acidimicrobiia bacterium]|nr:putative cytokinetic ring protein SteA [Acidimicrobiia bacterium]